MSRVPVPFVFGLGMLAGMAALVVAVSVSGCSQLAALAGVEACVAVGRSASPGAPSATPTTIVIAIPTAAPSAAPAVSSAPRVE